MQITSTIRAIERLRYRYSHRMRRWVPMFFLVPRRGIRNYKSTKRDYDDDDMPRSSFIFHPPTNVIRHLIGYDLATDSLIVGETFDVVSARWRKERIMKEIR